MPLSQALAALALLGACFAGFGLLGRLFPCNPGQAVLFSRSIWLDMRYCALGVLYAGLGPALAAVAGHPRTPAGDLLRGLPLCAQVVALLGAADFIEYWLHRAFHGRWLWPFHAIHHAAEEVNWTTTFRIHPVNYLVQKVSLAFAARWIGFPELALLVASPLVFLSGAVTHANLRWTFGPLRFVIASPVFHRWHHSADAGRRDRNFGSMFSVWDLMFGSFHMPCGRLPEAYGADGPPPGLIAQIAYPFSLPAAGGRDGRRVHGQRKLVEP